MKLPRLVLPATPDTEDEKINKWMQDLTRVLQDFNQQVANLSFGNSQVVEVADSGNANAEITVQHNLNRIPTHAYISYSDVSGNLYDSGTAWTDHIVYLKYSGAHANLKVVLT